MAIKNVAVFFLLLLLKIILVQGQERLPHPRFRRNTAVCQQGNSSYYRLKDDIHGLKLKSAGKALMTVLLNKYLNGGKTSLNAASDRVLFIQPVKKLFTQMFPSGKTKPESLSQYGKMLQMLSSTLNTLSIEFISFDGMIADNSSRIVQIVDQGVMYHINKARQKLEKCKFYNNKNGMSSFRPDSVLYTYTELDVLFTDNNASTRVVVKQKILYTTLSALVKVLDYLNKELEQRYQCL